MSATEGVHISVKQDYFNARNNININHATVLYDVAVRGTRAGYNNIIQYNIIHNPFLAPCVSMLGSRTVGVVYTLSLVAQS